MTRFWLNARRRPRRLPRATVIAFVALAVVTALAAPAAGFAQDLDPLAGTDVSLDGGVTLPAEVEASLDGVLEGGGVPAVDEVVPEQAHIAPPDPVPEPEAEAPVLPNTGMPSETAPAPAPENLPTDVTGEAQAPINLNVDIRILSPGDNGGVHQEISAPGGSTHRGGGSGFDALDWTWNWNWTWDCGSDASTAGMEWNWNWTWKGDCGPPVAEGLPDPSDVVPDEIFDAPEMPFADSPAALVTQPPVATHPPADDAGPGRTRRDAPPLARSGDGPRSPHPSLKDAHSFLTVVGSSAEPASLSPEAAHATQSRRQADRGHAPAPEQAPPVLPSAAASPLAAGSSAPLAAALLALLCLLAPRALELARCSHQALASLLSSSRLERPG